MQEITDFVVWKIIPRRIPKTKRVGKDNIFK